MHPRRNNNDRRDHTSNDSKANNYHRRHDDSSQPYSRNNYRYPSRDRNHRYPSHNRNQDHNVNISFENSNYFRPTYHQYGPNSTNFVQDTYVNRPISNHYNVSPNYGSSTPRYHTEHPKNNSYDDTFAKNCESARNYRKNESFAQKPVVHYHKEYTSNHYNVSSNHGSYTPHYYPQHRNYNNCDDTFLRNSESEGNNTKNASLPHKPVVHAQKRFQANSGKKRRKKRSLSERKKQLHRERESCFAPRRT